MPTDTSLAFDGVTLVRGPRTIIREASFTIRPGERWFLLGRNGTGKSTLLLAALGLLPVRAGRILRHGAFAGPLGFGPVPQRAQAGFELPTTVAEFVGFGTEGLRLARAARAARIAMALRMVGLAELGRRDYRALSEGQRQRIGIARAIAREPDLLLCDEPTASLDPRAAQAVFGLLDHLTRDGTRAILCATHDLEAARAIATHVAVLEPESTPDAACRVHQGSFDALWQDGTLGRALGLPEAPVESRE